MEACRAGIVACWKNTVVRGEKEINCCFLVASNIVFGKTAITRAVKLTNATQRNSLLFILQNGGVAHYKALFHTGKPQKGLHKVSHEAFWWTHINTAV